MARTASTGDETAGSARVRGTDAPSGPRITPIQAVPHYPMDTGWIEAQLTPISFRQRAARRQR
jgi:hypothetical protein